MNQAKE
jgi:hypothetical protein